MKKVLTDAMFVKAVYRHYQGETLSSIAKDYGIGISTLSETRDRRRAEWNSIREKIIEADISVLCGSTKGVDIETRKILTHLLYSLVGDKTYDEVLRDLCHKVDCTEDEGKTYIQLFESILPVHIPRS